MREKEEVREETVKEKRRRKIRNRVRVRESEIERVTRNFQL